MMNQSLNPIQKHLLPWLNCYLKHFLRCTHTISMRIKIQQLMLCVLKVFKIPLMHYIIANYIANILHIPLPTNLCKISTGLHCMVAHIQFTVVLFDVDPRLILSKLFTCPNLIRNHIKLHHIALYMILIVCNI